MRVHRILAAALCVAALPPAASADICPTGADLATGITIFGAPNEMRTTYTSLPDGLRSSTTLNPRSNRPPLVLEVAHALALVRSSDGKGATYERSLDALDSLDALGAWSSAVTVIRPNGDVLTGEATYTFLGHDRAAMGPCGYVIWRVLVENDLSNDETGLQTYSKIEKLYAPDLGLVLTQIYIREDGTRVEVPYRTQITAE